MAAKKKPCITVNKNLLPLKLTLFFYSAAAFAILPYLTIHMKDIGISDIDVALIYTILPFCVFVAPPVVGFFADKLGNYTRVLILNIIACGVFHTLLLFVPHNNVTITYPAATAHLEGGLVQLRWEECGGGDAGGGGEAACELLELRGHVDLHLFNCSLTCPSTPAEDICSFLNIPICKPERVSLMDMIANVSQSGCGEAELALHTHDPCSSADGVELLALPPDCSALCTARSDIFRECGREESGRLLTIGTYFGLRMLATMALACCFIMLDAQTIQMCTMEEAAGKKGAIGRQIVYKTLAQAIISPLVGLIMDKITEMTGSTNYVASFVICDVFLLATIICVCLIEKDIGLPKDSDTMKGLKAIFTNVSCITFLIMMFICGCMFGFVETFLFVFLKEDLNAPIYLLGLTITTGALVSIPFLYYSEFIVNKFGMVNVIILALIMYGVRYVGYSYVTCAWYAFPFEALEVFTIFLLSVGSAKYVQLHAPSGTLATLTGLSGGAHYGFGKGVGGLVGGVLKETFASTAIAFRLFGAAAFAFGVLYATFHLCYGRKVDRKLKEERELEAERQRMPPLVLMEDPILKAAESSV